jgi:microcystin-dependent protein
LKGLVAEAEGCKDAAGEYAGAAEGSAAEASASETLARKWAENPEDEAVVTGKYSALHWAEKSRQALADAEAIKEEIQSLQGVVTYLTGHDFGDPEEDADWQRTLTDYALAQVPEWESVPNSCDVVNLWNGHEWIYNIETSSWVDWGSATVTEATSGMAGIVKVSADAAANTAALRNADAQFKVGTPTDEAHAATKGYVDSVASGIPAGFIGMWSGAAASIPSGWALCDGSGGTPDLRDKFLVGAGNTYAPGATGGAASVTSGAGSAHSHTQGNTGSTTLTEAQMPSHAHSVALQASGSNNANNTMMNTKTAVSGGITSGYTGSSGSHAHSNPTTATESAHTHAVSVLPPYYALCFIMKL